MMAKKESVSGDTPRYTFRFPDTAITKLDELVLAFAEESGRPENRTTVLLQLITREHNRRAEPGQGKKGKK
jgi:hypothetical protein